MLSHFLGRIFGRFIGAKDEPGDHHAGTPPHARPGLPRAAE